MSGIIYRKNNANVDLRGSSYTEPNTGTMRLCVRDGNGNIVKYGFTTLVSASQYSPSFYVNGKRCYIGKVTSVGSSYAYSYSSEYAYSYKYTYSMRMSSYVTNSRYSIAQSYGLTSYITYNEFTTSKSTTSIKSDYLWASRTTQVNANATPASGTYNQTSASPTYGGYSSSRNWYVSSNVVSQYGGMVGGREGQNRTASSWYSYTRNSIYSRTTSKIAGASTNYNRSVTSSSLTNSYTTSRSLTKTSKYYNINL